MVFTLSLVVVFVSAILLYLTTDMILKDKKAYLYDSAYLSLNNGYSSLELFFESKINFSRIFLSAQKGEEVTAKDQFKIDSDLFQVITLDDPKSLSQASAVEIAEKKQLRLFTNPAFLNQYKRREKFLDISDNFLLSQFEQTKKVGLLEKLYYEKEKAPRFLVFVYHPETNKVFCFDFLLDNIYTNIFSKQSFETSLVDKAGQALFHNRPHEINSSYAQFFKFFINQKSSSKNNAGVIEQDINAVKYILGYKQLSRFPDHYLFSAIKTSDAYEVTTILIFNTIIFTICLVGIFNIISIFIARSITNPLEKLIDVIKNISSGKFSSRVGSQTTSELQLVANAFNEMVSQVQTYQEQLIEYNRTLEQKVQERTEKLSIANKFIKTMVDSLGQGLLVFDRKGICLNLYTKACENLLNAKPPGRNLGDLIKAENKELLNDWIANLFEEMIPFQSLVELGQKSIPTQVDYSSNNFKHVTLEFFPMRDEEEKVQNIVMVASDKTKEFKAYKEVEAQQNYVKLVTKVIKDKSNFLRFTNLFEVSLKEEIEKLNEENIDKTDLLRLLHSMKGSAAFYSLSDVVNSLHDFESGISTNKMKDSEILERIKSVIEILNKSIEKLKDIIGETSQDFVEIEEHKLRAFWRSLHDTNVHIAESFASQFLQQKVENYIEQYKVLVLDLSIKLGKKINPILVENGDLSVDMKYFQEFFDSCIHLFRNAVDHAIEDPGIRSNAGKTEEGSITISFKIVRSDTTSFLEFSVQDDGGGIDAQRIRKKLIELNYPQDILQKSDGQIIYHIFDAHFSTADHITDVSGRGVGLYDIKKNVEKLDGTIELETKVGIGSRFSFLLPLPLLPTK